MEYFYEGSPTSVINDARAGELIDGLLEQLGPMKRVLLIPPDFTRFHSGAGQLTAMFYERLKDKAEIAILPALGTHFAMTPEEIEIMFPGVPAELFQVHDWRNGLARLGTIPGEFVAALSEGKVDFPIHCEIDKQLVEGGWDYIFSIGQLVPHEVIGIANHNKNIYVGTGGGDTINKSHFLGAVCNMEQVMGREISPVRAVFNECDRLYGHKLPIIYVLTVRAKDESGKLITRGIFSGDTGECFLRGAKLCQQCNLDLLDAPLKKVIVFLDPEEFKSTWLGNKAIYRTRMAMADDGDLIIVAPGVKQFGEDSQIDKLIRKYGYHGTPHTLELVRDHKDMQENLGAAAHLIHGSSEGRFRITYCAAGLSREEIEGAGFIYGDCEEVSRRYRVDHLQDGFNTGPDGEEIYYISNPALGLWGLKSQFEGIG